MTDSVDIGSASTFALLASASIACTGKNDITGGNVGVSSSGALSGFPPGKLTNGVIASMATAQTAQVDLSTAYNTILNRRTPSVLIPAEMGGITLGPGFYYSSGAVAISTGNLTLSGSGNFVFQVSAAVAIAATTQVILVNGASSDQIFWQVGGAFAIGANSSFYGTLLGNAAIAIGASVTIGGRLLTRAGALSMDSSALIVPDGVARKAKLAVDQKALFVASTVATSSIPVEMPDGRINSILLAYGSGIPAITSNSINGDPLAICVGLGVSWKLLNSSGIDATTNDLSPTMSPLILVPTQLHSDWTLLAGPNPSCLKFLTLYNTYTLPVNPCFSVKFYIRQINNWLGLDFNQNQVWLDVNQLFIAHTALMSSIIATPGSSPTLVKIVLCDSVSYANAQFLS